MRKVTRLAGARAIGLAASVASVVAGSPASSQVQALASDLLKVLNAAYYPLQIMAYCFKEVSQNTDFQSAGTEWNQRNASLLAQLEEKAKAERVSNALRVQADKDALAAIEKVVGSQSNKVAYCSLIRSIVDGGGYDLAVRQDLKDPLRRIFPQ